MAGRGDEPIYSIGAVARMLGVPTSTLRGWEKRYGMMAPGRSKGSHRLYSMNDVEQLRFIKTRLDAGASAADAHRLLAQKRPAGRTPQRDESFFEDLSDGFQAKVVVGGGPVPIHAHYPTFYASAEGRLRLAIPFLRDGLRLGQTCFLAAAGSVRAAHIDALARAGGDDIEEAIRNGQLVVVDGPGRTVEECVAFWERSFWKALEGGTTVIRVVGEMESEREIFSSEAEMMRYEVAYNGLAKRFPTVTLCQYDVRTFTGEVVYEAFKAHPDVYGMRAGTFLS
jgi:DNA-binding transcriptional MerR regulator